MGWNKYNAHTSWSCLIVPQKRPRGPITFFMLLGLLMMLFLLWQLQCASVAATSFGDAVGQFVYCRCRVPQNMLASP